MTTNSKGGVSRTWIIAAIAAAVLVVVILVAVSATGDSKGDVPDALVGVDEVEALFKDIPQSGLTLGTPDAVVTIREFADLQCPFCAQAASGIVPQLVDRYVKPGTAKLVYEPMTFIGDDSVLGARALWAAGEQGKAWQFADVLFKNQGEENGGWLNDAMIEKVAGELGLDVGKLNDARGGDGADAALKAADAAAQAEQVQSTPTFLVRGPKGQVTIQDSSNIAEFDAAVNAVK